MGFFHFPSFVHCTFVIGFQRVELPLICLYIYICFLHVFRVLLHCSFIFIFLHVFNGFVHVPYFASFTDPMFFYVISSLVCCCPFFSILAWANPKAQDFGMYIYIYIYDYMILYVCMEFIYNTLRCAIIIIIDTPRMAD